MLNLRSVSSGYLSENETNENWMNETKTESTTPLSLKIPSTRSLKTPSMSSSDFVLPSMPSTVALLPQQHYNHGELSSDLWSSKKLGEWFSWEILPFVYTNTRMSFVSKEWHAILKTLFPVELLQLLAYLKDHEGIQIEMDSLADIESLIQKYMFSRFGTSRNFYLQPKNVVNSIHLIRTIVYTACTQRNNHSDACYNMYKNLLQTFVCKQYELLTDLVVNIVDVETDQEVSFLWNFVEAMHRFLITFRDIFDETRPRSLGFCFGYLDEYYLKHHPLPSMHEIRTEAIQSVESKCKLLNSDLDEKFEQLILNSCTTTSKESNESNESKEHLSPVVPVNLAVRSVAHAQIVLDLATEFQSQFEIMIDPKFKDAVQKRVQDYKQICLSAKEEAGQGETKEETNTHVTIAFKEDDTTQTIVLPIGHPLFHTSTYLTGLGLGSGDVSFFDITQVCTVKYKTPRCGSK